MHWEPQLHFGDCLGPPPARSLLIQHTCSVFVLSGPRDLPAEQMNMGHWRNMMLILICHWIMLCPSTSNYWHMRLGRAILNSNSLLSCLVQEVNNRGSLQPAEWWGFPWTRRQRSGITDSPYPKGCLRKLLGPPAAGNVGVYGLETCFHRRLVIENLSASSSFCVLGMVNNG